MVLPTGTISMSDLNVEIGASPTALVSLNDNPVRITANVLSGVITMNNLRGKSYFRVTGGTTSVSGAGSRLGAGSLTVTSTTASVGTVVGGVSPYSYLWENVSGDTFSPTSSTSASSAFGRTEFVGPGAFIQFSGVYRCRITDTNGLVIYGPNCTINLDFTETS